MEKEKYKKMKVRKDNKSMEKDNWIEKVNNKFPSAFDKKLYLIGEFKKRIFKQFKLKKERGESERWAYYEKRFGYLDDTFYGGETYQVDLENGEIKILKK